MMYKLLKPLLFKLDAEKAHDLAIGVAGSTQKSKLLQTCARMLYATDSPGLGQHLFGLHFPNPIGLAAGFDKNGTTPLAMQALGFGFVEIGSITAKPNRGNPKPRAFRLPADRSIINRMGLNNDGADLITRRLAKLEMRIPLGINIAKTNDAAIHGDAAIQDYLYSYEKARAVADYITINISCPNTGDGRTFEEPAALRELISTLNPAKSPVPALVKISVDTAKETLEKIISISEEFGVAGYVATNTSSLRENLKTESQAVQKIGRGGLSGAAIRRQSTERIRWVREIAGKDKPIIGVGGIDSPAAAFEKLEAGANLLQLYTGLIYEGPALLKRIKRELARC